MDGLTQFLQLLIEEKNGKVTKWDALNKAYKASAKTITITPNVVSLVHKWNALDKSVTQAGFLAAYGSYNLPEDRKNFIDQLEISSVSLKNFLDYQNQLQFKGVDVNSASLQFEINALKVLGLSNELIDEFTRNTSRLNWSTTQKIVKGDLLDFKNLAHVRYVTDRYDFCNETQSESYMSMSGDVRTKFDACIQQFLGNDDTDDALAGFSLYKFHQLEPAQYLIIAEQELADDELQKFQTNELQWNNVTSKNSIVANIDFWKVVGKAKLLEEICKYNDADLGILIIIGKAQEYDNHKLLTMVNNFCATKTINEITEQNIIDIGKLLPIENTRALLQTEIEYEISVFKSINVDEASKKFVDELANPANETNDLLPFLSTSIHLFTPKISPIVIKSSEYHLDENELSSYNWNSIKGGHFDLADIEMHLKELDLFISYCELLSKVQMILKENSNKEDLVKIIKQVIVSYLQNIGERQQVEHKTYSNEYLYNNTLFYLNKFKKYVDENNNGRSFTSYAEALHVRSEGSSDIPDFDEKAGRTNFGMMRNSLFASNCLGASILPLKPSEFITSILKFYKNTIQFKLMFPEDEHFEGIRNIMDKIKVNTVNAAKYYLTMKKIETKLDDLRQADKDLLRKYYELLTNEAVFETSLIKEIKESKLQISAKKNPGSPASGKVAKPIEINIEKEIEKAKLSNPTFDNKKYNQRLNTLTQLFQVMLLHTKTFTAKKTPITRKHGTELKNELQITIAQMFENFNADVEPTQFDPIIGALTKLSEIVTSECKEEKCTPELSDYFNANRSYLQLKTDLNINVQNPGDSKYKNLCMTTQPVASKNQQIVSQILQITDTYLTTEIQQFVLSIVTARSNILRLVSACTKNNQIVQMMKKIVADLQACAQTFIKQNFVTLATYSQLIKDERELMENFARVLINDFEEDIPLFVFNPSD